MTRSAILLAVVLAAACDSRPTNEEMVATSPWWELCSMPSGSGGPGQGLMDLRMGSYHPPGVDAVTSPHGDTLVHFAARIRGTSCLSNLKEFGYHSPCSPNEEGKTPADLWRESGVGHGGGVDGVYYWLTEECES